MNTLIVCHHKQEIPDDFAAAQSRHQFFDYAMLGVSRDCRTDEKVSQLLRFFVGGAKVLQLVSGRVGGPLFEPALTSLAEDGRHLAIVSKPTRRVSFNLTDFYHNRSHLIGVDSLGIGGAEIASIMDELRPGFESGALLPFDTTPWPLARAAEAYAAADRGGDPNKQILLP